MTLGFFNVLRAALGDSQIDINNRGTTDVHIVVGRTRDN
jgi:hypothetical protein